ncbi:hypothetical protein BDR07DRAFT_1406853 [Suillus spraguei]|nr:hypothetical protein BDR07DRAFT_1406853 [Suillus spraguei]
MTSILPKSDTNSTLSTETIVGIVIGVVGGAAAVAAACFYWRRWRRSKGNFTGLHDSERAADPEEEFVSGGSSFSADVRDRQAGYGHRQQPSVSLEPLLLPPSPQSPQDILARSSSGSAPQIPPDWSYYLPPILPNIALDHDYPSLYDTDDPFARIQRAILPTSPTHHTPVSPTRRVSHEVPLEQYSRHTTKNGPDVPLFINRTRTRHSGPDFFPSRASTSPFSPADPSQSMSSRTGSEAVHLHLSANAPPSPPPKPQISILSPVAESTTSNGSREETQRPRTAGSSSPKSLYSQESAPHPSHPPEPSPPPPLPAPSSKRGKSSLRYSRTLKLSLSDLTTVMEGSTSTSASSPNSEMQKKSSRTFSELETSSSLSVAHSHNTPTPEYASLPLLSSNNAFGKSGSTPSTLSPSSSRSRTTRYPSLTPSSLGLSSSGSAPHTDSATEWHRPPEGLNALKDLQILDLPNPHGPTQETPQAPADRQLGADKKYETETLKARLRTHSPCSVAEVERRPVVQCGIANIDVTL